MADFPKYKVLIEGIQVDVQSIIRTQIEGESSQVVLYLWPTNKGTQIKRGSFVVIFRYEERNKTLEKTYKDLTKDENATVEGVWVLFWDGYVERNPSISRKESRSLILHCQQWSFRMNSMYMRAFNMGYLDLDYNKDRAFMGINLVANNFFDVTGMEEIYDNIMAIERKILKKGGGIGGGLVELVKEASNWDDLYARVEAVANIVDRFTFSENPGIKQILQRENLARIISRQVVRMSSSTTLMKIVNQIMYQTLYTFIALPSPMRAVVGEETKLYQFIYKPQLFFAVPIVSNAIFPSSIDSMEPINTRVNQPTRVMVESKTRIGGKDLGDLYTKREYFPEVVAERVANYKSSENIDFSKKFTDEEFLEERLVPGRMNMPFPDGLMHEAKTESEETIAKVYGRYMYEIERNISEPIRVQMKFDPYLICGLSSVIFDDQFGYILGRLRSIQDTIDLVNQTSKTQIEMANVRVVAGIENGVAVEVEEEEFQIENYESLFGSDDNKYAIFDDKFKNESVGEEFYKVLFGVGAINNKKQTDSTTTITVTTSAALMDLYTKYSESGESLEEFILSVKHRPIITEGEYMSFIDASPEGIGGVDQFDSNARYKGLYSSADKGYTGSAPNPSRAKPFMKERQDIILQYIEDIDNAHFAKTD